MRIGTVFAVGCIVMLVFAGVSFGADAPAKPDASKASSTQTANTGNADALIGKRVESKDGKEIGEVKKIVKSSANGQPEYAIISSTNKLYPVPLHALTVQPGKETVALNVDKKKFNAAPSYPADKMPDMTSPAINVLINRFYSQSSS